jgi:hypothetical protein
MTRTFKDEVRAILDAHFEEHRKSERISLKALLLNNMPRPVPHLKELKEHLELEDRIFLSKSLGPIVIKKK